MPDRSCIDTDSLASLLAGPHAAAVSAAIQIGYTAQLLRTIVRTVRRKMQQQPVPGKFAVQKQ